MRGNRIKMTNIHTDNWLKKVNTYDFQFITRISFIKYEMSPMTFVMVMFMFLFKNIISFLIVNI